MLNFFPKSMQVFLLAVCLGVCITNVNQTFREVFIQLDVLKD